MAMISIRNLKICYGEFEVVPDLSVDIEKGEFFTLLGPSGCGKTTVLRAIAGFVPATSGQIFLNGEDITHKPAEQRDVGIVFQNYALFPHMTIYENIAFGLKVARKPSAKILKSVDQILEVIGIAEHRNKKPEALSGGQQQRVAIARSLVMGPKVLLFDEPLSNLDAKVRDVMRKEIKRLRRELEFTAVFVTHDQDEALSMSDRLLVFNEGRADQIGTSREIYSNPATPFVCNFVGSSNELGPKMSASLELMGGGRHFVRPEEIKLSKNITGESILTARVTDVDFLGPSTSVDLSILGEELSAIVLGDAFSASLFVGQEIAVTINPESILKFGSE